ncbi:MAG: WYL domain-containing protein [Candidatus Parcubacteria bacterium]|nr:MAG: WYL domain-containing protein [Candidatus Parcubacteria bacterium]
MNETFFKFALKKMPINKNAWIRYLTLDRCFRNTGRKYYIDDLVDACNEALLEENPNSSGIKKRQIFNDINYMRSSDGFSAPIETYNYNNRKYYRYEDTSFSILQALLPQNIIEISKELLGFLVQIDGLAPMEEIHNKLPDLLKYYNIKKREPFVEFDFNFDYEGLKNFSPIFIAIANKQVMKIKYFSYNKKKEFEYIFHPHYLKEYRHRWYVIGYNETEKEDHYVLGLERMIAIDTLPDEQYIEPSEDYKEYFYDIIGVTKEKNKKPQKIILKVHPEFEKYIITRPFHPSQKNKHHDNKGWRELELHLIINEEFINHLMPYIHYLKIESPQELKDKIRHRLNEGLKLLKK